MHRYLLLLLALPLLLLSDEDLSFETPWSNPVHYTESFLVADLINPLTGQCTLQVQDLVAKGAQDIVLTRFYTAPMVPYEFFKNKEREKAKKEVLALSAYMEKYGRGWVILPHIHLESTKKKYIVSTPSGYDLEYDKAGKFLPPEYGLSNFDGHTPSGRNDPRNSYIEPIGKNKYEHHLPDGTVRIYENSLLQKEVLPNRNIIRFTYSGKNLIRIDSTDLTD